MGRLKKIKKEIKKNENVESKQQVHELKGLILVILAVFVIFIIFYIITTLINPKTFTEDIQISEETIQYKNILIGEMLNRSENNYYVLVKDNDNSYNELYVAYLDKYISDNKDYNYYVADLADAFNQNYISDKTEVKGNDISNYKFNDTTLIKVKKNKVDKVYTSHDDIFGVLKGLVK